MYRVKSINTVNKCTSKINFTPKGVYLPISKLHSILAVANLLAHNNKSQICYCGQISLQSAAVNCSFSDNMTPLEGNINFAGDDTFYSALNKNLTFKYPSAPKVADFAITISWNF